MTWDITDYSTTPSDNTAINGISIGEGCNASNINDAIRQMMADIATTYNSSLLPSGAMLEFAGSSAPSGFLLCDGSAISRTTYAALFSAVGTTFGTGDGSTTFNVPDKRGRVSVGAGTGSALTARTLAATGGEETHTLSASEAPALTTSVSGTTGSGGGHTHTLTDPGHTHTLLRAENNSGSTDPGHGGGGTESADATGSSTTGITIDAVSDHTHSFSASGTTNGGGGAHNNMQPFIVVTHIIKT